MAIAACGRCGQPVKWVWVDGERMALDTVLTVDGRFRLKGEAMDEAEAIDRPGHTGYTDHGETCPVLLRERRRSHE